MYIRQLASLKIQTEFYHLYNRDKGRLICFHVVTFHRAPCIIELHLVIIFHLFRLTDISCNPYKTLLRTRINEQICLLLF